MCTKQLKKWPWLRKLENFSPPYKPTTTVWIQIFILLAISLMREEITKRFINLVHISLLLFISWAILHLKHAILQHKLLRKCYYTALKWKSYIITIIDVDNKDSWKHIQVLMKPSYSLCHSNQHDKLHQMNLKEGEKTLNYANYKISYNKVLNELY